jgi:F-type H+-transporting ATPase subunit gamma
VAGGQERALRRRIKSVQSTKKITKAMELISASRIAKAQERVAAARPYSDRITEVIRNLAAAGAGGDSPLLNPRSEITTVAYVVVAADRGLAGGYNSAVIRAAERAMAADREAGRETALITVGKKATGYFRFRGYDIAASFVGFSDSPGYEDAREVARHVAERFESGEYSEVQLAYTQFKSMGTQVVDLSRYMPLDAASITGDEEAADAAAGPSADYEFEPAPATILERLLPRYAEARLYAAFLDAAASEHAARQRAMKSATENAEEMIVKLSRVMNRARQDAITTEIMEIVGGAEALRQSATDSTDLLVDRVNVDDLFPAHAGTSGEPTRTLHFSAGDQQ